jgi:hypothetical protein
MESKLLGFIRKARRALGLSGVASYVPANSLLTTVLINPGTRHRARQASIMAAVASTVKPRPGSNTHASATRTSKAIENKGEFSMKTVLAPNIHRRHAPSTWLAGYQYPDAPSSNRRREILVSESGLSAKKVQIFQSSSDQDSDFEATLGPQPDRGFVGDHRGCDCLGNGKGLTIPTPGHEPPPA